MALLVNSSTLEEMIVVWRNICIVLLSPNQNDQFKMSLSALSKLAEEMNGDPDKTNFILHNVSVTTKGQIVNNLNMDVSNFNFKIDWDFRHLNLLLFLILQELGTIEESLIIFSFLLNFFLER